MSVEAWRRAAVVTLVALIALVLAWEMWLAPLRPGGSWLALRALPLVAALPGILRARRYTYQWASMLALFYVGDGAVRAWSEIGTARTLAWLEIALATGLFLSTAFAARALAGNARGPVR